MNKIRFQLFLFIIFSLLFSWGGQELRSAAFRPHLSAVESAIENQDVNCFYSYFKKCWVHYPDNTTQKFDTGKEVPVYFLVSRKTNNEWNQLGTQNNDFYREIKKILNSYKCLYFPSFEEGKFIEDLPLNVLARLLFLSHRGEIIKKWEKEGKVKKPYKYYGQKGSEYEEEELYALLEQEGKKARKTFEIKKNPDFKKNVVYFDNGDRVELKKDIRRNRELFVVTTVVGEYKKHKKGGFRWQRKKGKGKKEVPLKKVVLFYKTWRSEDEAINSTIEQNLNQLFLDSFKRKNNCWEHFDLFKNLQSNIVKTIHANKIFIDKALIERLIKYSRGKIGNKSKLDLAHLYPEKEICFTENILDYAILKNFSAEWGNNKFHLHRREHLVSVEDYDFQFYDTSNVSHISLGNPIRGRNFSDLMSHFFQGDQPNSIGEFIKKKRLERLYFEIAFPGLLCLPDKPGRDTAQWIPGFYELGFICKPKEGLFFNIAHRHFKKDGRMLSLIIGDYATDRKGFNLEDCFDVTVSRAVEGRDSTNSLDGLAGRHFPFVQRHNIVISNFYFYRDPDGTEYCVCPNKDAAYILHRDRHNWEKMIWDDQQNIFYQQHSDPDSRIEYKEEYRLDDNNRLEVSFEEKFHDEQDWREVRSFELDIREINN